MRFFVDVVIAALAIYVAYRTFKAWRQLAEWRISMYTMGMALLAFALVIEAFLDIYLSTFFNYEPMRYIKRLESTLRVITQMLYLAALIPLAVAVTPSRLYSIILVLLPINIALSIYIAVVTLVKLVEKKIPPFISLAFLFLAFSMVTPLFSILDLLFRLLTALFLAMGVVYAEKKEK
ncbi:MAG: hypothetical protein QXO48_06660 [Desulfurococcaceae archaeon]